MISLSRCPHAGHLIVDLTSNIDLPRHAWRVPKFLAFDAGNPWWPIQLFEY